MNALNRREFLMSSAAAGVFCAARAEETASEPADLAPVSEPGVPARKFHLLPPGAESAAAFALRCVGCQLCVSACPNKVLRPAHGARLGQPEMGFNHGWCRPECTTCGTVCPAGAIRPIARARKPSIHTGHAIWHADRCLAAKDGTICTSCARHCPAHAITLVPRDPGKKDSPKVPSLDKIKCIGCGACENLCPVRPLPAMTLKGFEKHREDKPMTDAEILAQTRRMFDAKRAAVALAKGGIVSATENGRGLGPLLQLLDYRSEELKGAWVIDKVIGRAAAAVCVLGGAARVHAALMSEDAAAFLKAHKIPCSCDVSTPRILNRDKSDACPLEKAVEGLDDPKKMLAAIRKRLTELRAAKPRS